MSLEHCVYNKVEATIDPLESQIKVLMIDDDELIARSTSDYFNILGVKTAYVTCFDAAVDFLEKHEVSLLLLDINLGDRSGFELWWNTA